MRSVAVVMRGHDDAWRLSGLTISAPLRGADSGPPPTGTSSSRRCPGADMLGPKGRLADGGGREMGDAHDDEGEDEQRVGPRMVPAARACSVRDPNHVATARCVGAAGRAKDCGSAVDSIQRRCDRVPRCVTR